MRKNDDISVKPVYITAADGTEILKQNVNNRPKKNRRVEQYTREMLSGMWKVKLPISVILDTNGELQNGQHCLTALEDAEAIRLKNPEAYADAIGTEPLEIAAIIIEGVLPEDADLLDVGGVRNHSDILYRKQLFGVGPGGFQEDGKTPVEWSKSDLERMSKILGTAAKIIYMRLALGKKLRHPAKFHHADMLALVENNQGLVESVSTIYKLDKEKDEASGKAGGIRSILPNLAYAAAAHYLAWHSQLDAEGFGKKRALADKFFTALASGKTTKDMPEDAPVFALRTWLSRQPAKRTNDILEAMYDAVVLAWNATANKAKHPLSPKSPFKVNVKEWSDGYVVMGGLDIKPPVVEEPVVEEEIVEEVAAVLPEGETEETVSWSEEYGMWYKEVEGQETQWWNADGTPYAA